jgi:hypothetical protein
MCGLGAHVNELHRGRKQFARFCFLSSVIHHLQVKAPGTAPEAWACDQSIGQYLATTGALPPKR